MDIRSTIGNNLRSYRERLGLSQEQLSEMSGVYRTTLGSIERGVSNPRCNTLQNLADALDIAVLQLFAEFDESGGLVIGRSTKEMREKNDKQAQKPKKGRRKLEKTPKVSEEQINYGLISWGNNLLFNLDVKQDETEQEFAIQTLGNLRRLGYGGEELTEQFTVVWPKIKEVYGLA